MDGVPGIGSSVEDFHGGRVGPPEVQGAGRGGVGVEAHEGVLARTERPLGRGGDQGVPDSAATKFTRDPDPG